MLGLDVVADGILTTVERAVNPDQLNLTEVHMVILMILNLVPQRHANLTG